MTKKKPEYQITNLPVSVGLIRGKFYDNLMRMRKDILLQLRNHVCELRFRKMDGSMRLMQCTLMETFLPEFEGKEKIKGKEKRQSSETMVVWDLEKQAWRSYRLDTFLRLTVTDGKGTK